MFINYLNAVTKTLKQQVPEIKEVLITNGGFGGMEQLKSFVTHAPAVAVGIDSMGAQWNNFSQLVNKLSVSLMLVTSSHNQTNQQVALKQGYLLLEKILLIVKKGHWDKNMPESDQFKTYSTEQGSINVRSYFGEELYKAELCLWEITWQQAITLGEDVFKDITREL